MGYESKIYFIHQLKDKDFVFNDVLAIIDMRKMGYEFDYLKAFPNTLDGTLCVGEEYIESTGDYITVPTNKDCYGDYIKCGTIDSVLNELKKHLGNNYYMFDLLYSTLMSFKSSGLEDIIVAQYGY